MKTIFFIICAIFAYAAFPLIGADYSTRRAALEAAYRKNGTTVKINNSGYRQIAPGVWHTGGGTTATIESGPSAKSLDRLAQWQHVQQERAYWAEHNRRVRKAENMRINEEKKKWITKRYEEINQRAVSVAAYFRSKNGTDRLTPEQIQYIWSFNPEYAEELERLQNDSELDVSQKPQEARHSDTPYKNDKEAIIEAKKRELEKKVAQKLSQNQNYRVGIEKTANDGSNPEIAMYNFLEKNGLLSKYNSSEKLENAVDSGEIPADIAKHIRKFNGWQK